MKDYNFTFAFLLGKANLVADALSQNTCGQVSNIMVNQLKMMEDIIEVNPLF